MIQMSTRKISDIIIFENDDFIDLIYGYFCDKKWNFYCHWISYLNYKTTITLDLHSE